MIELITGLIKIIAQIVFDILAAMFESLFRKKRSE